MFQCMKYLFSVLLVFGLFCTASCSNPAAEQSGESNPVLYTGESEKADDPGLFVKSAGFVTTQKDLYEEDDTPETAGVISPGVLQEHNFFDDGTDYLIFTAARGVTYTIETWVYDYADTKLYLYDSAGNRVGYNDDKAKGNYGSKITYTTQSGGTHYIKLLSYGGKTGEKRGYTVSVTASEQDFSLPLPEKEWTILVYLCGDNNLSPFADKDIEEMKAIGSSRDFNIVVLWDNADAIHGYYYIEKGNARLLKDLGEVNLGQAATAQAFIDFGLKNFPARRYFFDIWNHGGAVDRSKGVAWDDTNGEDHLTEAEQREIIKHFYRTAGRKLDIMGFDCCLMATAEIGHLYAPYTSYLVASEELEPGNGWDYTFLKVLQDTPTLEPLLLAKAVFDSYLDFYTNDSTVTFSVADLAYSGELSGALDRFCRSAINSGVQGSVFKKLTAGVGDFTGYTKDLYGYLRAVSTSTEVKDETRKAAVEVMNIIKEKYIRYEGHGSKFNGTAHGTSITMKADTVVYSDLDICRDTSWNEFLTFCGF